MTAWPGGPCPQCGEDMPANVVHCVSCRALLNPELEQDSVEVPAFVPLPEIDCMIELKPRGFYVNCPHCERELRINSKYLSETVSCKFCEGQFLLDLANPQVAPRAFYGDCPYCSQELRIGKKYAGMKVACKHCAGKIQVVT